MMPGVKRIGGKVVEFTSGDFAEAYRTFVALLMLTRD
jgi:D-aminopeptidase